MMIKKAAAFPSLVNAAAFCYAKNTEKLPKKFPYEQFKKSFLPSARLRQAFTLFPQATNQVAMLAWIFGDCREGQIPRSSAALQI